MTDKIMTAPEVKPLPPEPGLLAVVLDRDGLAWQREAGTGSPDWHSLDGQLTWAELNRERGPLTLLRTPSRRSAEETTTEAFPSEEQWPEELLNARVRFWMCPVEHPERRDSEGWVAQTVAWRGNVAHCLEPGCGKTSAVEAPEANRD